ncbi:MAG TPA: methylated-DNA--[protein]-cysteine S-methyltransferase [Solirubrobacteraceae bacterium]|jgi:methylated-DNA-[protein]-cysteine S-methyltransferase|nr:methylated-DNA--[protein]-cysteine S-methyltransferase [Solirubrobacteraceae bacterium]
MTTITTPPPTDQRTRLAVPSPIGELVLEGGEHALTDLVLPDSARASAVTGAEHDPAAAPRALADAARQLGEYFAGERTTFELALRTAGTPFQREVWTALAEIPYGETISYAELAASVERPHAFRAVGSANGANPIAIIVPCHRVITSGGSLGGYAGGLDAKRTLLALEGVAL